MLISIQRYRDITGDDTSASGVIETAITEGQQLLESTLGRGLELTERTERVRVFADGSSYPSSTPLVSVPDGVTVQGAAVLGAWPSASFVGREVDHVDFTYTGGFDPDEDDMAAATYVPVELARAVAFAAQALLTEPASFDVPEGATSVSVGDVSITFGPGGSPASGEITFPRGLVRRWRFRRDMAA